MEQSEMRPNREMGREMQSRIIACIKLFLLSSAGLMLANALFGRSVALATNTEVTCDDSNNQHIQPGSTTSDLLVTGPCKVPVGTYVYQNVNIYTAPNAMSGGILTFDDAKIDFYAENIIVEAGGALIAGSQQTPIGTATGGQLTIHLWGPKTDAGARCKSTN